MICRMASGYVAGKYDLVKRLHRIEGQVRGIERMVLEERYARVKSDELLAAVRRFARTR